MNKRCENQRFSYYYFFPKNRRGQFYLIASLAIIAIIAGVFLIGNNTSSVENPRVFDVAEELNIEYGKVLDRGAVTGNYGWDEFTGNFSAYSRDVTIVYIFGDYVDYNAYYYLSNGTRIQVGKNLNGDILTITYDGTDYEFPWREGENFYYVVSQKIGDEKYVARN